MSLERPLLRVKLCEFVSEIDPNPLSTVVRKTQTQTLGQPVKLNLLALDLFRQAGHVCLKVIYSVF